MRLLFGLVAMVMAGPALAQVQPPIFPDAGLTPGMIDQRLTPRYLCSHSAQDRRGVTQSLAKQVFAAYRVDYADHSAYEVDHFLPLFLGGVNNCSNSATCNLWPQPHQAQFPQIAPWGSETKDLLEGVLYRTMCPIRNKVRHAAKDVQWLRDAQSAMIRDWRAAYRKFICDDPQGKTANALAACR